MIKVIEPWGCSGPRPMSPQEAEALAREIDKHSSDNLENLEKLTFEELLELAKQVAPDKV